MVVLMGTYGLADFLTDSQPFSSKFTSAIWMPNEADSSGWCWLLHQIMSEIDQPGGSMEAMSSQVF